MDITRFCTHTYALELGTSWQHHNNHIFVWVNDSLFCYFGPKGFHLFCRHDRVTDTKRRRFNVLSRRFPHVPMWTNMKKTAHVIEDANKASEFIQSVYYSLSKDFVKDKLLA